MAAEVTDLKEQIEKAKESLKSVDENIRKITGRDPNEPRPNLDGRRISGGGPRGREVGGILGRRSRDVQAPEKESEPARKRIAVFSRLGPAAGRRRVVLTGRRTSKQEEEDEEDEDEEEEEQKIKPAVQSSVVSTAKKITKSELISAQNAGEKGKARNRRMFGMLLGTLARFDRDGQGRQTKQAQKQKEVETRLEEETAEERKKLASQRRTLFSERRSQQRRISLLEQKVALADELAEWEKEWSKKSNFIMTKASPGIFFMPKDFTPRTQRALQESKARIKEIVERHKKSVEETMNAYDDEIKLLDGKQDDEDGKGEKNKQGNNVGSRGLNFRRRGAREEEPEEEMDLDSMEPQVDIKVEMDENEGDDVEKVAVSNGATETSKGVEISQHPCEQNHDVAMEEGQGDVENVIESDDDTNPNVTEEQRTAEGGDGVDDNLCGATEGSQNDDRSSDVDEKSMDLETGQEKGKDYVNDSNPCSEIDLRSKETTERNELQAYSDQKSDPELSKTEADAPDEKDTVVEDTASTNDDVTATPSSEVKVEESTSRPAEVAAIPSLPDCEREVVETSNSKESSSPANTSGTGNTLRTLPNSSTVSRKSMEISREGESSKSTKKQTSKLLKKESSSSSSSDSESEGRKMKSRRASTHSKSSDGGRGKVKAKEAVGRRTSASERKARLRKRKESESSSDSESSSSSSSSSSDDDRHKKRSSRSHRNEPSSRRRSKDRPASHRSSSGRRRSRSRSRDRSNRNYRRR